MNAVAQVVDPVDPVDRILTQLTGVRQYGQGWRADCPVGHSSKGSLSIAHGDNSRAVIHCFACGGIGPVLDALGLRVGDLFVQSDRRSMSPEGRKAAQRAFKESSWAAALGVLATEATVIEVAVAMIGRGEPLAADDIERVRVASQRIHDAREVLQ